MPKEVDLLTHLQFDISLVNVHLAAFLGNLYRKKLLTEHFPHNILSWKHSEVRVPCYPLRI